MTNHKTLTFVKYKTIDNWSVSHIVGNKMWFNDLYPMVSIGDIIEKATNTIEIQDEAQYKQVTLKTNGGGAVLRDIKSGRDIGTKKQYVVTEGQFIMSKIDARNGAFGVITKELDGAIVTADFPVFNVNTNRVLPQYLFLLSSSKRFAQFAQSCSRGTTNRQRIDVGLFLSQQIPLPPLSEQHRLFNEFETNMQHAADNERQASEIERGIDNYLLDTLGITLKKDSANNKNSLFKYFHLVRYKEIDRWDCCNPKPQFKYMLENSTFDINEIGSMFHFINRGWNKVEKSFKYIELGAVDPFYGILKADTIQTDKAPSRATQKVKMGDLIVGTTRPYLKKFAIVNSDYDDCVCSSGFQVISPDKSYNIQFLYEYLKSSIAIAQFESFMTGALYPAITSSDLKRLLIPTPPLSIQNSIVDHITAQKAKIKQLKQTANILRETAITAFENQIYANLN